MKFSNTQKLILGLLVILVICLFSTGLGIVYITYGQQFVLTFTSTPTKTASLPPPRPTATRTNIPTPQTIAFSPTPTSLNQSQYTPFVFLTSTPFPSVTPFTIVPRNTHTPVPNPPAQNPVQQNPPQQNPNPPAKSSCGPQLDYAQANHQYKLSRIDATYSSSISFYESLLQQAVASRDAIAVAQYQRDLQSVKNQYNSAIQAENQRYESEVNYIKSTCQ